jgi:hypothetical protein
VDHRGRRPGADRARAWQVYDSTKLVEAEVTAREVV